jgi:hypothetical protein
MVGAMVEEKVEGKEGKDKQKPQEG